MEMESTQFSKPLIKASCLMAKNMEKAKSYSRADLFSKDNLSTTWNKVMEKCITILRETIFKETGKTTKNKDKGPWIGLI